MAPSQNFEVQFGPLAEEFKRRGLGSFTYSQGTHEVAPPPGWEDYFGKPPLYRFLDVSHGDAFETLRRLRHVPRGLNPEDTMRQLQGATVEEDWHQEAWRQALDGVFKTIDEDPEINAIIGYSEGAMVAASAIVEEKERCTREKGRERRIKVCNFISLCLLSLRYTGLSTWLTDTAWPAIGRHAVPFQVPRSHQPNQMASAQGKILAIADSTLTW